MKPKILGALTILGTIVLMIALTFAVAQIMANTSSDGWAALGAVIMMLFLLGFILVVELIVGIVLYYRKDNPFGLGMLYGLTGLVVISIATAIIVNALNLL